MATAAIATGQINPRRTQTLTVSILVLQLRYHSAVEDQLMRMKSWLKIGLGAALSLVTSAAGAQEIGRASCRERV